MAYCTLKRIVWDIIVLISVFFLPWIVTVIIILLSLAMFSSWYEGIVAAALLDMMLFSAILGAHSLYMIIGFIAVYYISIRIKYMLRIA
jgi:hypothetical protein